MELHVHWADRLDPVALYAALVATSLFLWNVYVWHRSGASLRGDTMANMVMVPDVRDDTRYVVLNVSNVGKADTTITHVILFGYKDWRSWVRKKPTRNALINHPVTAYPLPYVLKPGQMFTSMVIQNVELEEWSREMRLYAGVIHSMSKRPFLARVSPIEAKVRKTSPSATAGPA